VGAYPAEVRGSNPLRSTRKSAVAIEPRIRIAGRHVRLVRAALPMKICPLRRPPSAGGSSPPRFGLKLFIDAQAPISVPSSEKWSVLSNRFTPRLR
jgi:hypothetical protein